MMAAVSRGLSALRSRNDRGGEPTRHDRTRAGQVALASLLVLIAAVMGLHVRAYDRLSPIDELHHVDYMIKAAHGQLLRRGDVMGPETRKEGACRGVDAPGYDPGNCDDEAWLAGREFNTEEIQPPAYYFLTGWAARALRPVLGTDSLVVAARMAGAAWMAAGVAALWAALAMLGVPLLSRWAVSALVITTPVVLHASATVTNDATSLVAGALVLAAVLAWERGRLPGFVVALAAFVAVSLRLTNFVGVGAVVVYLVLRTIRPREAQGPSEGRDIRSSLLMAALLTGVVLLTGLGWVMLNSAVARTGPLSNPNTLNQQAQSLRPEMILGQVQATVTPARDPYLVPFLRNGVVRTIVSATDWVFIASALGLAALAARGSPGVSLGASTFLCAVMTGPVLTVTNYVFQHAFYAIPARYGLSLIPAFAAGLGLSLGKAWVQRAVVGLAGIAVIVTLLSSHR